MVGGAVTRTRFAPSPTGPLHLGHAFAAVTAARLASPGQFLLRIEDIDRSRSKAEWETAIFDDLRWLELSWAQPVMRQSDRMEAYRAALGTLNRRGLLYPCRCKRSDIQAALSAPQEGVIGPDGPLYPGTCRNRSMDDAAPGDAIRLDVGRAFNLIDGPLQFIDNGLQEMDGAQFRQTIGDPVLARRGMGTSYHLSVVVDDAAQGITLVTRGADLFDATWIHVLLQQLLDLPTPAYHHHALIRDDNGKRLAKRDDARAIASYRTAGMAPAEVLGLVGL